MQATRVVFSSAMAFAGGGATGAAGVLKHTDLLRALLKNMKVLNGLRGSQKTFDVAVTGLGAQSIAAFMKTLEGGLNLEVVGDSVTADISALKQYKNRLDGVLICQAYHSLQPSDVNEQLAILRTAVKDEDGAIGMFWQRALSQPWVDSFTSAATAAGVGSAPGFGPALAPKQTPMVWVDEVLTAPATTAHKLKPFKHRKFIEKATGSLAELAPLLRATHDARFPLTGSAPAFVEGLAAVAASEPPFTLPLDLHAFHTTTVPSK